MLPVEHTQPFPDYIACPQCGEPEVEVWCYATNATCHACGHIFEHALPAACQSICETVAGGGTHECANV